MSCSALGPHPLAIVLLAAALAAAPLAAAAAERFDGRFYRGEGDIEYLELLDISRRMFAPDPEFQNAAMLYTPSWNGFVEGPTWGAWWIQNSYGPTYCALPFYTEPYVTFLQNAQDLWFDQMGDGKRVWTRKGVALVIPDGQLCDAASPNWFIPKQGDGRVEIHDWGVEFTAAGLLMQAELLLISRDPTAIAHYLPRLERCANFLDTRRDPKTNLFLAGPAGNLLAPSYAGWERPDGSYHKAYLAGLSVTTIAALDRLVELETLARRPGKAALYTQRRDLARKGLPRLTTPEGYFLKYLDPDGTPHGLYGAPKHGYFEATVNHDAICFRVADDAQAHRIYAKLASIPGLRRHGLIVTNHPTLDDMYRPPTGWLWKHGTWVNGGHWTTCEARMIMAYYRLGKHADARRAMEKILSFARAFRMDNPLVDFGNAVYQPKQPINLCYDTLGAPAAMVRGLFEYLYRADALTLIPHTPPAITRLEQHFPIRFGSKRLWLATTGSGPVTAVLVNGKPWKGFDTTSVSLPYDATPQEAVVAIALGGAQPAAFTPRKPSHALPPPVRLDPSVLGKEQFPVISTNRLPLRIGADSKGGSRFVGDVARPMVFGRALRQAEIAALAHDKPGALANDPALVGAWTLDRAEGGLFPNAAGKGLAAKAVGKVDLVDSPHGKAIRLAGDGYLEVAADPRLDLATACTLAAWIRPKTLAQGGGRILDKSEVGTSNAYLLDTFPGNSLRLIVERGAVSHNATFPPDQWAHVAATVDGDGTRTLHINGKRVAGDTRPVPPDIEGTAERLARLRAFHQRLVAAGLADSYEAAHARLAIDYLAAFAARLKLLAAGTLEPLPQPSRYAADKSYLATTARLAAGLEKTLASYATASDPHRRRVHQLWTQK